MQILAVIAAFAALVTAAPGGHGGGWHTTPCQTVTVWHTDYVTKTVTDVEWQTKTITDTVTDTVTQWHYKTVYKTDTVTDTVTQTQKEYITKTVWETKTITPPPVTVTKWEKENCHTKQHTWG